MSGPKVVRVRTREEIAAECYALIAGLRAAIENCQAFARHHDCLDAASVRQRAALLEELAQKVEAGDFETVRRICQAEDVAVRFELETIEKEVLERAAAKANRRRRCRYMAGSLIEHLQKRQRPVPAALEGVRSARIGDDEADLERAESVVSGILASLTLESMQGAAPPMTDAQRTLATALSDSGPLETLEEWVATKAASTADEPLGRVERLAAEVRALDASPAGAHLLARAQAVFAEPDAHQRAMRIDSLLLEWSQRRNVLREVTEQRIRAKKLAIELERIPGSQAAGLAARLSAVASARDSEFESAIADANAYLAVHTRDAAAAMRRRAVLQGLASLGYEVGSDLSTAWAERDRVVVRKPDRSGYGVELAAPPDAGHMQVKVVAIGRGDRDRDSTRDRDAETLWCSEFAKLQQLLAQVGTNVKIVRALGVGAVPLAQVEDASVEEQEAGTAERLRNRTL